jgi:hypothetical protein
MQSPCRNIIPERRRECKYYFQIILKKFHEIPLNPGSGLRDLEQKALLRPGDPAFGRFGFHKYNVGADAFDTVPGDYVVIPAAGYPEKTAGPRYDHGTDVPLRDINLNICDKPQPLAGADTDDFLALEVSEFDGHGRSLPLRLHQFMQREVRKER